MKKILFFIPIVLISLFVNCAWSKPQTTAMIYNNLKLKDGDSIFIMLYYPPKNGQYLIPQAVNTVFEKSIEYTLMKTLFSGTESKDAKPFDNLELKDIKLEGNIAYLKINSEVETKCSIYDIYAIVNTLTEFQGINRVMVKLNGTDINKKGFTRDRNLFKRDKKLNPAEVLYKQMKLEKQGEWMESYLLMSDKENDKNRKYFNEYIKELEEIKDVNFLNQDFIIGNYIISGNVAKVKVNFYTIDENGKKILGDDLYFKCIKINDVWLVDWLTTQ